MVADIMIKHPRAYWSDKLDALGVPNGPLNTVPEVLDLAQTEALEMLFKPYADSAGQYHGLPISFDGQRAGDDSAAPKLGRD